MTILALGSTTRATSDDSGDAPIHRRPPRRSSTTSSAPRPAPPRGASHVLGSIATGILVVGVLTAILTTRDSQWWTLHFSQLGTFDDFSGRTFNTTVMVSGMILAAYGVVVGADLPASIGRRRSIWMRGSIASAGAHLTMVGLIPIPFSMAMHDLAAVGLALSFLSLVASGIGCSSLPKRFRAFAFLGVLALAAGMALMATGVISLACYEAIAFSTMGVWLLALPRAIERRTPVASETAAEQAVEDETPFPSRSTGYGRRKPQAGCRPAPLARRASSGLEEHSRARTVSTPPAPSNRGRRRAATGALRGERTRSASGSMPPSRRTSSRGIRETVRPQRPGRSALRFRQRRRSASRP